MQRMADMFLIALKFAGCAVAHSVYPRRGVMGTIGNRESLISLSIHRRNLLTRWDGKRVQYEMRAERKACWHGPVECSPSFQDPYILASVASGVDKGCPMAKARPDWVRWSGSLDGYSIRTRTCDERGGA
ncbi:hypothetical protein EDB92DRAFT_1041345 [Lactarius akahatsu]|uniref:Uncharacterized protein n=1 Tax=Lactarius akahatsu TaxID=416441 RepID=A0AAD4LET9_9AGAM|nr:hypothetical protein EDB92DRAFT_1041345 [Lactarius akahatsu]